MINVVIIESDPMVNMIIEKVVRGNSKFNVVKTFTSGEKARNFLAKEHVDLLIMDIFLTGIDGFNLLKEQREKEFLKPDYVDAIIITASKEKSDIKKALQLGVSDYLAKPFEISRLKLSLERYAVKKKIMDLEGFCLNQQDIDKIYNSNLKVLEELPKGINLQTLEKIKSVVLNNIDKEWSSKELAEKIRSSSVTVKKYLDYLATIGNLHSYTLHGSVGRPEVKYRLN